MAKKSEFCKKPAIAVDIAGLKKPGELFIVPALSETKEYGKANNLDYSIPRYVGESYSYFCTRYKTKKGENWVTYVNPIILSTKDMIFVEETQYGVEGTYLVPRHPRILVAYTDLVGGPHAVQRELVGMASIQFQQALHAVNGLYISDFGLRIDNYPEYQEADDEGKQKIVQDYFSALKETLNTELDSDEKTKEYLKATQWAAEQIQIDNAKQGVLPGDIEKKLNEEADKADGET